jgi:hypothetical protein
VASDPFCLGLDGGFAVEQQMYCGLVSFFGSEMKWRLLVIVLGVDGDSSVEKQMHCGLAPFFGSEVQRPACLTVCCLDIGTFMK